MHPTEKLWHGYGEDWVPHFIREYQIEISNLAWSGYLNQGKGMMICEVDCPRQGMIWDLKTVRHHFSYASIEASIQHLQRLELSNDTVSNLAKRLKAYVPDQEAILLITGKGEILVVLMQNLTLAEIYKQHQSRTEFSIPSDTQLNTG